ncbi:MAG TPA: VWA domain-containing protein, partial [Aggregatilineales bacterium]|nr:VWA domain-containing protein [Aggregatilineales bacterium]
MSFVLVCSLIMRGYKTLAQDGEPPEPLNLEIADVNVDGFPEITITVNLARRSSLPVTGIGAADFALIGTDSDKFRIENVQTLASNYLPVATLLIIDTRDNMSADTINAVRAAALEFISVMNAGDSTAIISIGSNVQLLQDYTSDTGILSAKIAALNVQGSGEDQKLYEATAFGVQLAQNTP